MNKNIPNINPGTLIPYGVISGKLVPDLVDEIMTQGVSAQHTNTANALRDGLTTLLTEFTSKTRAATITDSVFDDILAEVGQDVEIDEECFSWTTQDGFHYELGYLGGAIIVYVCKSPYMTYAPACSPCIPNAGDLDSAHKDAQLACYSLDPEDYPEELFDKMAFFKMEGGTGPAYRITCFNKGKA